MLILGKLCIVGAPLAGIGKAVGVITRDAGHGQDRPGFGIKNDHDSAVGFGVISGSPNFGKVFNQGTLCQLLQVLIYSQNKITAGHRRHLIQHLHRPIQRANLYLAAAVFSPQYVFIKTLQPSHAHIIG